MKSIIFISAVITTYLCSVEGRPDTTIYVFVYPGPVKESNHVYVTPKPRNFGKLEVKPLESSCVNPNGIPGTCKIIHDCKPLLDILNKNSRTSDELKFLQKSQCGFQGTTPTVCCPPNPSPVQNGCTTPDGKQGNCVDVYQCKHLADLLVPPVSQQSITLIKNSKCNGPTQYSVCCGPAPTTTTMTGRGPQDCKSTVSAYPPDPSTGCCGIDSIVGNKIVGGTATRVDQYPWLALIDYVKDGIEKHLCGGALISGKYVLTAGHCVIGDVLKLGRPRNVRLSEYDVSKDGPDCAQVEASGMDCTDGELKIAIDKTIPHPEYNPNNALRRNDIALIRLKEMAPFTDFIRPICLPQADLSLNPPINFTMYAAGWGAVSTSQSRSNIKLHVDLPFVEAATCQEAYTRPGLRTQLWNKQLCAGGMKDKDSCKGDSGGPLMYENGRIFEITGVVSFGPTPCGMLNTPGVYSKVFEYKDWILSTIVP